MDTHPTPFPAANSRTCAASSSVNVSLSTSFTPSIDVNTIPFQAAASDIPNSSFYCVCAALAEVRA